ncbi:hypothetical protein STEG23_009475 [Scotinomys teguina]
MARKAGQGKEEEESRARQQEEKTPVRDGEKTPACHGRGHHVVEQEALLCDELLQQGSACPGVGVGGHRLHSSLLCHCTVSLTEPLRVVDAAGASGKIKAVCSALAVTLAFISVKYQAN